MAHCWLWKLERWRLEIQPFLSQHLVLRRQVDPDVFAALPKDLQEELKSAYNRGQHNQAQGKICTSVQKWVAYSKQYLEVSNRSLRFHIRLIFIHACCIPFLSTMKNVLQIKGEMGELYKVHISSYHKSSSTLFKAEKNIKSTIT